MQIGINWSPEAAELLAGSQIDVDIYKCADWHDMVADARSQRPAYVHFPLVIGSGQSAEWDFTTIEDWLQRTETRFVNCHITPDTTQFALDTPVDRLIEPLIAEVQRLVDAFGAERVIIENCPMAELDLSSGRLPQGGDPQIFQAIIAETACGWLLDVSHAVLTCEHQGQDVYDYLDAMPVQHIRELHVNGIGFWEHHNLMGDHKPMRDEDWQHFDYVIDRMRSGSWRLPDVATFEYGGTGKLKEWCGSDKAMIAQQMPRFYKMLDSLRQSINA